MIDLSERATEYLMRKGEISKEEVNIYRYGFSVTFDAIIDIIMLIIIGGLMKHFMVTVLFILVFTSTRVFTGGYHAETKIACTCITALSLIFNILFSELIIRWFNPISYMIITSIFTIVITYLKAPVRNKNKILDDDQANVYHRKSLMLVSFFVILAGACYFIKSSYSVFICTTLFEISFMMLICRRCKYEEVSKRNEECK